MKRVLVLEDNDIIRQSIVKIVKKNCPDIEVHSFDNLIEAYGVALSSHIDLFILDIILQPDRVSDSSGYDFAKKIRTLDEYTLTPIVFITSISDNMIHAFQNIHCYDYLVKPINENKLSDILYNTIIKSKSSFVDEKEVDFRYKGTIYPVKVKDIIYLEVKNRDLHIYKNKGVLIIPYMTLQQALEIIDSDKFVQCHRSIAVNKDYIDSINNTNHKITMSENIATVDIGFRYQKLFKEGKPK